VHFREIPFLRLLAPLCGGVIVAEAAPRLVTVVCVAATVSLVLMTMRLFRRSYFSDMLFGTALIVFLLSAGYILRTAERMRPGEMKVARQTVTVRLSSYPEKGKSGCSFQARIVSTGDADSLYCPRGSLMLWFMTDTIPTAWGPGDRMVLDITPRPVTNNGNPCEFNYRRYLEGRGIKYMAFFRPGDIVSHLPATRHTLRESSLATAQGLKDTFRKAGLQGEELGLVTALTLGDKELLGREQLTSFSRSGAMHVMAVSGLHVGMISMTLSLLLFFLRGRLRVARALIVVAGLWGFAFITGMSPSVLRATIMFTFLQAGALLHRPASPMNNLLASAFILTALHPVVLFEAGFQLSYLAVAFILSFYNRLSSLVRVRNRVASYLWQMTAVSFVAQAGTLALTVRLFNIFPLLSLATNIVVIPVTFVVMVLAILLVAASPLPPVSAFIALILDRVAGFTLSFTGIISSMDHGVITGIGMSAAETVMLTATIALLLTSLLRVRKITLKPFLVTALLLLACNGVKTVQESRHDRVIVYNIRGDEFRARQLGRHLLMAPSGGMVPAEVRRHAATRGLKIVVIEPG
jgi:competence protein ComEC